MHGMTTVLPGASVWEQRLFDHLTSHLDTEVDIVREYQALADDAEAAPALRYVAAMIVDDERRHHQLFADLAESVRQMGELRDEDEPIPSLRGLWADADRVLPLTERLMAVERADAKELKALAHELRDVKDTTLYGLLVELMRHDTEKHLMILRFLRACAKDAVY